MNKIFLITFGLVIASCGPAKMLSTPDVIVETPKSNSKEVVAFAKEANVSKTLKLLTSDELEGRDSGSKGIEKASIYLENLLQKNNIMQTIG